VRADGFIARILRAASSTIASHVAEGSRVALVQWRAGDEGSVVVESDTVLRLKRREQKEQVLRRARELAESGRFEGWQGIEFQLRFFDGFPKARTWITGPLRKELNSLCRNARIRKSRVFKNEG
jgi:hypothetical protein